MFKCQVSGKTSNPHEKPVKVITKTRVKQYFNSTGQVIATGWEIVEEILALRETQESVISSNEQ